MKHADGSALPRCDEGAPALPFNPFLTGSWIKPASLSPNQCDIGTSQRLPVNSRPSSSTRRQDDDCFR